MARTLVLVRHGKAERARGDMRDIERSLTPAGVEALVGAFPRTFSLLADGTRVPGGSIAPAAGSAPVEPTAGPTAPVAGPTLVTPAVSTPAVPFALWTSPALRARQTTEQVVAALAANRIAASTPEEHDSLWEQDCASFLEELAATPADARIVAVGHIPFMSSMLELLTCADISFAPGGVACVTIAGDPREATPGRLAWFVQGPKVG